MRLFVAIPLAQGAEAALTRVCARLRSSDDRLRWSAPESWHITLQFLGNADEAQLACLQARLAEVRSVSVPVRLGALDVFERAGALVVGVDMTPELEKLQRQIVAATERCGFVSEDRPYHPHITLARAKGDGRRQLKELKSRVQNNLSGFIASEFLLYESHLGSGGSKYERKGRFAIERS